jgi:hypothetical protein
VREHGAEKEGEGRRGEGRTRLKELKEREGACVGRGERDVEGKGNSPIDHTLIQAMSSRSDPCNLKDDVDGEQQETDEGREADEGRRAAPVFHANDHFTLGASERFLMVHITAAPHLSHPPFPVG